MTTAERIKELRTGRHMTMQELGDKCGVSRATVSMWEAGDRTPARDSLQALADVFNVSLDYLTGKEDISMRYLTSEEMQIIDTFRSMDDSQKDLVRQMFGLEKSAGSIDSRKGA